MQRRVADYNCGDAFLLLGNLTLDTLVSSLERMDESLGFLVVGGIAILCITLHTLGLFDWYASGSSSLWLLAG